MRRLRIAVYGAGVIGREHIRRLERHPRAALAAVVDPNPAAAVGFPTTAAAIDGAIIATPTALHVPVALSLIERGIPLLVEKPLAETVDGAARVVEASERAGVPVLAGYHRRHGAIFAAARDYLASGVLGRLVAVKGSVLFHKPAAYFNVAWRTGPSGGPILINLAHEIDLLRALAGEITAVRALGSRAIRGLAVEDTVAVLLGFQNGALGTLVLSDTAVAPWSWEQTAGENPLYARDASQDSLVLAGTQGSLALPGLRWWRQAEGDWTRPFETGQLAVGGGVDPLERQLDHFCDVVEGLAAPLVTARDAMASLAVTLAVREEAIRPPSS